MAINMEEHKSDVAEAKEIRGMLHSQGYTSVYCVDSNMKLISTDE